MIFRILLVSICCFFVFGLAAQEEKFEVTRTKAIDRSTAIQNVFVDSENQKWAANTDGIHQIYSSLQGAPQDLVSGQINILSFPDGNQNLMISKSDLYAAIGENTFVTCARYDEKQKQLWIGSYANGVFSLAVEPSLRLLSKLNTENSKLTSNRINTIFIDKNGKKWIGTEDGALVGGDGKWDHKSEYFSINAFDYYNNEVWVAANDILWWVDRRGKWSPMELDADMLEGPIVDMSFDTKGRLWIASEIMTWFNIDNDSYQTFSDIEYFTSQFVNRIDVDADNAAWIATEDKGLYVIQEKDAITLKLDITDPLDCQDASKTATVTGEAFGGVPPFEYVWADGQEGASISGLGQGVYTLKVTDSKGTVQQADIEILDPKISAEVTIHQPAGADDANNGIAEVSIEGGQPDYIIKWDNGATEAKIDNLSPGTHEVVVSDQAGCSVTLSFEVPQELTPLTVEIEILKENRCFGEKEAGLEVMARGGKKPYSFNWAQKEVGEAGNAGLGAGTYTVTVTDVLGNAATASVEVTEPEKLSSTVQVVASATANNSDGSASASATGGKGVYQYSWSNGNSGPEIQNLAAGKYQVTVTDENGCTVTNEIEVTEDILPLSVTIKERSSLKCADSADGKLTAIPAGGKSPYKYYWNTDFITSADGDKIVAGSYSLTVTDAAGQTAAAVFLMKAPDPIVINVDVTGQADVDGSNGKATAIVKGGTGKYKYAWDNGESKEKATALSAGEHKLFVTDDNGCTAEAVFNMSEDIQELTVRLETTEEIKCAGSSSGAVNAKLSGGKGPFIYAWGGQGSDEGLKGVESGGYSLTVTDATGATATASVVLDAPDPIVVAVQITASASTNEKDGKAVAQVSGGKGKYSYAWDNGETKDKASALGPGSHNLIVTDENGCTGEASFEVTEDILPLSVALEVTADITCAGGNQGSISASQAGGKGPFNFSWSGGESGEQVTGLKAGSYTLTVTDAADNTTTAVVELEDPEPINVSVQFTASASTDQEDGKASAQVAGGKGKYSYAWDNGETKDKASALGPGNHILIVTDENGCTGETTFEVTEDILPLSVALEVTGEVTCAGGSQGSISASQSGGKGPFNFSWSSGESGEQVTGLKAGSYTLTVTDAANNSTTADVELEDPTPVTVSVQITASATTDQQDGKANAQVSGGNGKYTYAWDNGETKDKATALAPGTHKLLVTDDHGCTGEATFEITEDILPLSVTIQTTSEILCAQGADGAINATTSGGKGPFTFAWNNNETTEALKALQSGTYVLTVTDAANNSATADIALEAPEPIEVVVQVTASATTNNDDGKATATVSGGKGKYTFDWDNGESKNNASSLGPGAHELVVTDGNGCTGVASFEITENILPLAVTLELTSELKCAGASDAAITAQVNGGKSPFTYNWNNNNSTAQISDLAAGEYRVIVTDAAGSTFEASQNVTAPDQLVASVKIISNASANGSDGEVVAEVTGGTAPYKYVWNNGGTESTLKGIQAGDYTLEITDNNGCMATAEVAVTEEILPLSCDLELVSSVTCNGALDAIVKAKVSGGKSPYGYAWQGSSNSNDQIDGIGAGSIRVVISDAAGQEFSTDMNISEPDGLKVELKSKKPSRTEKSLDGKAEVVVSGGTAPYTYNWANGESVAAAEKLTFGLQKVTITDKNGCTADFEVDIQKKILPDLTAGMLKSGQTVKIERLQFQADSSVIENSSIPVLTELYQFLEDNPFIVVEIGGHTNGLPSHDFCDRLSSARAKEVANYLNKKGISAKRLFFKGYGKRDPIATNQTKEGRTKNQRVEVKILKIEEG